ncbi:hypothetical protein ACGFSG_39400 [Streptomyces sp. NPDC048512]|uniref:hypothetical protein n=1 Tax=Streptomyces sp. NPDC048512 TaxID=3365563 RepID=UPI0037143CDE
MTVIFSGPSGEDTPGNRLKGISDQYIAQISSIIEINRSVIPELAARKENEFSRIVDEVMETLPPAERKASRKYLTQFRDNLGTLIDSADTEPKPRLSIEIPERGAGAAITHLILRFGSLAKAGPQDALLRRSLLVSAISAFEVLFGRVARTIYNVNISALNDSDHSFTLQEMAAFSTLDDAREYLIERRISTLLRDSIDGWEKWLKRACGGASMESLPIFWPLVRESFARRNLLVHTGGSVNHLYVSVVEKLGIPDLAKAKPGMRVEVNEAYLDWVLQELLALGHLLVCAVGTKLYKKETELFTLAAVNAARDLSLQRANHSSKAVCDFALSRNLSRRTEMNLRVRRWLSIKESTGLEGIRSEIEDWDTSGLDPSIAHCKLVLLDDVDPARKAVEDLITAGELSRFEIAIDPLYKELVKAAASRQEATDPRDSDD